MTTKSIHGTDCFEVEAFLHREEVSKLFKVRDKRNGQFFCMEVASRREQHIGSVNTFVQETSHSNSQFLINLKFTFQTHSKLYYILDYIGDQSLASLRRKEGPFSENKVKFYACEILVALEELHENGLKYGELNSEKVLIDSSGRGTLWRTFCGKKYWRKRECVCDLPGFRRGFPCENSHDSNSDREIRIDFQYLGLTILQLFSRDNVTSVLNNEYTDEERFSHLAAQAYSLPGTLSAFARDLVTRLLKGQLHNSDQVKSHPFFLGVKWHEVKARVTTASPFPWSNMGGQQEKLNTVHLSCLSTSSPSSRDVLQPLPVDRHERARGYEAPDDNKQGDSQYTSYRIHNAISTPDLRTFHREGDHHHHRPQSFPNYMPSRLDCYAEGNQYGRGELGIPGQRNRFSQSMLDLRNTDGCEGFGCGVPDSSLSRTASLSDLNQPEYRNSYENVDDGTDFEQLRYTRGPRHGYTTTERLRSEGIADYEYRGNDLPHRGVSRLRRRSHDESQYESTQHPSAYSCHESKYGNVSNPIHCSEFVRSDVRKLSYRDYDRCTTSKLKTDIDSTEIIDSVSCQRRPSRRSIDNRSLSYDSKHEFDKSNNSRNLLENSLLSNRAHSCSHLDRIEGVKTACQERSTDRNNPNKNTDRTCNTTEKLKTRKDYPLAQMPIPSFEDFKRRNSEQKAFNANKTCKEKLVNVNVKMGQTRDRENRMVTNYRHFTARDNPLREPRSERRNTRQHGKLMAELETSERKADITDNDTTLVSRNSSSGKPRKPKDIPRPHNDSRLSSGNTSTEPKEHGRSYFSKNEVIHNLMLKYGLYERTGSKRETEFNRSKDSALNTAAPTDFIKDENSGENSTILEDKDSRMLEINAFARRPKCGKRRPSSPATIQKDNIKITHKSLSLLTSRDSIPLSSKTPRQAESPSSRVTEETNDDTRWSRRAQGSFSAETNFNNSEESKHVLLSRTGSRISEGSDPKLNRDNVSTLKRTESNDLPQQKDTSEEVETGYSLSRRSSNFQPRDLDSSVSDVYKAMKAVQQRRSSTPSTDQKSNSEQCRQDDTESKTTNRDLGLPKTSKTLWNAAKSRLRLGKSPANSPKTKRKLKDERKETDSVLTGLELSRQENDMICEANVTGECLKPEFGEKISREEFDRSKPMTEFTKDDSERRVSPDSFSERQLHRNGLHTSLLSLSSSMYSTDTELDDSGSWHSELDPMETRRMSRRKRWESFHSNASVDSGSAHMFEFETDSVATEFDDAFDESEPTDDRPKPDVEVERADSGVGGDMGRDPRLKLSWEDIVLKSSKHWSVVAASARHWQEIARRPKENVPMRKKSAVAVITENMVECPECLKHYVPEETSGRQSEDLSKDKPSICSKCRERRVERKEAIIELVQTEINYGNDLQIVKEEFYSPMQSGGIFLPEHLAAIFLNLQELVEVNSKFCSRLQKSLEESVSKGDEEFSQVNVGSIFLESVEFFQSYEIYCSKQNSASVLLDSLQKKNELLKIFLNVTCRENPKCRKMDLNSFLLAPVQRIMKYPLLLSRIRKTTPRRNSDREKLMLAQRRIEEQLNRINSLNSTVDSKQRRYRGSGQLGRSDSLDKLQMKKMAGEILNWKVGDMQLLMHGVFEVLIHEFGSSAGWNRRGSKKTLDVFVLFCIRGHTETLTVDSDDEGQCEEPLFPTETEATDAALVMLKKKINGKYTLFREPLLLDSCVIIKDSERKDSFEILHMGRETYILKASTSRENRRWLKYLRLQAKDLGSWRKRRNGLPNIMIKTI